MKSQVDAFCARIGTDPLLVQGAGGNISWKEDNTLWVKASGTSLADAMNTDIFVPVALDSIPLVMHGELENVRLIDTNKSLRPSIETLLHGLMPHKIVLHLHPVDTLASMLNIRSSQHYESALSTLYHWKKIPYCKPGLPLASKIKSELNDNPKLDVILLENHGIIFGADTVEELENMLVNITRMMSLETKQVADFPFDELTTQIRIPGYYQLQNDNVNKLVLNNKLYSRLSNDWAICPDHVVFLGERPYCFESISQALSSLPITNCIPSLLFIYKSGIWVRDGFSQFQLAQLIFYVDVLSRLEDQTIACLSNAEIKELIDWESEKYRKEIMK